MRKKFNVRFFAVMVGALALLAGSIHYLHGYQVRRNARSLLDQARHAEESGHLNQAGGLFSTYLIYYPDDAATLAEYGALLDRQSALDPRARPRALRVLDKALRLNPQADPALRRRVAVLAMELGQFSDAKDDLDILLADTPNNGELEHLRGRCQEARGEMTEARKDYEGAIKHAPDQVDAYLSLAFLLHRRLDDAAEADKKMEELVRKNSQSFKAFLAQVSYFKEFKTWDRAAQAIRKARDLAPNEEEVILEAADLALANPKQADSDLEEARKLLRRGLALYPKTPRIYLLLAQVEEQSARRPQSISVLRQGLEALPDNPSLVWALAGMLIASGEKAKEQIELLSQLGFSQAQLGYLQARIHLGAGEWMEAIRILENLRPELARMPALALQAELLLGQAYGQIGDAELQYASFRQASEIDSEQVSALEGMGRALVALGRLDEGLEIYQRILPNAPGALIDLTRLMIVMNSRLAPHRQNWSDVEQALTACCRLVPEPADLPVLRAEAFVGQGRIIEARNVLNKVLQKDPKREDVWTALADLADRHANSDQALTILDEAQTKVGDNVGIRLGRAAYWAKRKGPTAGRALERLETGWREAGFTSEEQAKLLRGLALSYAQQDNLKEVGRIWKKLADLRPWDQGVQLVLFDLALRNGDDPGMVSIIGHLKELEKSEGVLWKYAQASELIWKMEQQKKRGEEIEKSLLTDARQLLAKAADQRPHWGRIVRLEGQIDDLQGMRHSAIKNFMRAIELGMRNPSLIQRTIQLLNQDERFLEAFEVARRMDRWSTNLPENHNFLQVIRLAREAASGESKDFRDHLWLGQVLVAAIQSEKIDPKEKSGLIMEAEKAFRQATKLSGEIPDPWLYLISFLVQARTQHEVTSALKEMESKFSSAKASLALAICHEMAGSQAKAQELYAQAAATRKNDANTLRALVDYYLRTGRVKEAQDSLGKIIEIKTASPEDHAWANRILSIVLVAQGSYQNSQKALANLNLIDAAIGAPASFEETPEDLRTKALVLAVQPSPRQRQRAIPILEKLLERDPRPDDQLLLAHCYEIAGVWPKAKDRFRRLLDANEDRPKYLIPYALALLRHQELDDCQKCLAILEKLPDQLQTFSVTEIKARLLASQRRIAEAVAQIRDYVESKESKPQDMAIRLELGASILDSLHQGFSSDRIFAAEAEKMYRECVSRRPEKAFLLASFMSRHGRQDEALDWCDRGRTNSAPLQMAQVALAILHQGPVDTTQYSRVDKWLKVSIERNPKLVPEFMMLLADLRTLEGNYAEAITTYRQVLSRDKRNAAALNNLAWILALQQGKGPEALDLAQEAIQITGPIPNILDTRGVIYLTMGRADQAIEDFESAVMEKPNPNYSYHLARAFLVAKNPDRAKQAFRRAKDLGFKPDRLDPLERDDYARLRPQLEPN